MKSTYVVRNYYVLPCCLLLLNLCIELVSYKARMIDAVLVRTAAIMGMVLFGASLVGLVVAPAISALVSGLHRSSRQRAGHAGEIFFLVLLGVVVFWLYYRIYIVGPESVLPAAWHNPKLPLNR
jgi:bacteriorhodopsin